MPDKCCMPSYNTNNKSCQVKTLQTLIKPDLSNRLKTLSRMTSNDDSDIDDDYADLYDSYDSLDDPDFLINDIDMEVDSIDSDHSEDGSISINGDMDDDTNDIPVIDEFHDYHYDYDMDDGAPSSWGDDDDVRHNDNDGETDSLTDFEEDNDVEIVDEYARPANPVPLVDLVGDESGAETEQDDDDEEEDEEEEVEVVNEEQPQVQHQQEPVIGEQEIEVATTVIEQTDQLTTTPSSPPVKNELSKGSPTAKSASDDDDGMSCSICLDSFTNSGAHRLVSLRCGHLFGHSCVVRWLKTGCTYGARRCPNCNKRAKMSDIRVIYAKKLQVMDTAEIEKLQLEKDKALKEKTNLGIELAKSKQFCQMQADKLSLLVSQLKQFDEQKSKSCCVCASRVDPLLETISNKKTQKDFLLINTIEINKSGGCRVLAHSSSGSLVVSQMSTNPLFAGYGIRKLDGIDLRPTQFIHLHKKVIRDLAFHQTESNLLLSVSLDKCAKLVDTNSNVCVQTFNGDNTLWSCCWSPDSQYQFLTGSQNGIVTLYDNRQPTAPVSSWQTLGDTSPVIALAPVTNSSLQNGGVFSCRFNAVQMISMNATAGSQPQCVLSDGPLVSMSYNKTSQMMVATCRPSNRSPYVRHIVSQLSGSSTDPSTCLNHIHTFYRGTTARVMSRSHQMLMPDGDSCVAAYNETSSSIELLSFNNGGVVCSTRGNETVVDLCSITGSDSSVFLASLTEKNLLLHKVI